jgi:transposase-like protein
MRPSKLTPAVRKRIALAVEAGATYTTAAEFAGVTDRTLRSWLARGRAEQDARKPDRSERQYVLLLEAVEQASARAEVRAAHMISKAAENDWRAAAFFLERRDPANWGKRLAVEHTEEPDRTFDELLDECTDEELEILQAIASRSRARRSS